MKKLVISITLLIGLAMSMYGQTNPMVHTISKDGKKTWKDCEGVRILEDNMSVVFWVSGSTYEVFDYVGTDLNGKPRWDSRANGKQAHRVVEADGTVVFWKTEKKAFYYKP